MTTEQQAEELTKAYLASYNLAMRQVRHPEFAAQIAGTIVFVINGTSPKQPEVNPFLHLLAQMAATEGQEGQEDQEDQEETGSKKKK